MAVSVWLLAVSCFMALCLAQEVNFSGNNGSPASDPIPADPNSKFLPITGDAGKDGAIGGGLLGFGLGAAGALIGSQLLNPCGRKRRQAEDGTSGSGDTRLFLGGSNCGPNQGFNQGGFSQGGFNQGGFNQGGFNSNPCGRKKRQISLGEGEAAAGDATETTNTRFFGNNNNNPCGGSGFNQGGFNQGGFNQGGFSQGGFNQGGFSQGGFNQGSNQGGFNQRPGCPCRCTSLTFTNQGRVEGNCRSRDNTGRVWCYTTGFNNQCGDLQRSQRFPNNPWSYNACRSNC